MTVLPNVCIARTPVLPLYLREVYNHCISGSQDLRISGSQVMDLRISGYGSQVMDLRLWISQVMDISGLWNTEAWANRGPLQGPAAGQ